MSDDNKSKGKIFNEINIPQQRPGDDSTKNFTLSTTINRENSFMTEKVFRQLADSVHDFVWIYDLNLKPLFFSQSIEHLLGVTAKAAMDQKLEDLFSARAIIIIKNVLDDILKSGQNTGKKRDQKSHLLDLEYRTNGDNFVLAETRIICQHDSVGKPIAIMGIARDVTERMEAIKTLSDSEKKHRHLLNSINSPALALNGDMIILYCNDAYATIVGENTKKLEGKNLLAIIPDFITTQFYATFLDVLSTGVTHEVEGELASRFMRARVYRTPWGILSILEDITEHKQAELRLRESESRFRTMADNIQDGLTIIELGKVRYVNQRACEIYGYPREELIRIDPIDLAAPEEHQRLLEHIRQSDENQDYINDLSYWIIQKNGTRRYIHNRYSINLQNGKIVGRYIVTTDITEQKKAQDELSKLSMAVEQSPASVVITNLNGKVEYVNPVFLELTGLQTKNAVGKDLRELQKLQNRDGVPENLWEWLRDGNIWRGEFWNIDNSGARNYCESGTITPIKNNEGELTHFLKVAENITEHKKYEEEIRFLGSVTEQVKDGIIVTGTDLKIQYINVATVQLCGYSPEELLNKEPQILSAEPIKEDRLKEVIDIVSSGKSWNTDQLSRRKDGSTFYGEYKISPLYDKENKISSYIIIQRDITKRKKVEHELQNYRQHLEDLVRQRTAELQATNAELEAFVYSVSHDLRTPLRAMHGFSQILLEEYAPDLDETGQKYAQRIIESTRRMEALIQDLLSYSRISRVQIDLEHIDLSEIIENVLVQLEQEIHTADAHILVKKPFPHVLGHHSTLEQIITNLLTNAIKFVQSDMKPEVKIWCDVKGDDVRVFIQDNGIGIEPEYHERIFRVFERLHGQNSYPGTGIGLAIVRKSVERLGGQVGLESCPESGSKFWFELKSAD